MLHRLAQILLRAAGWLLTPLVLITAAGTGALVGLLVAPILSPSVALGLVALLAVLAAVAGLVLWTRLLREHPRLRHTLEMTAEGAPDSELVQRLIHPDESADGTPP